MIVHGIECDGYFDENNMTLNVAHKSPRFVQVLVHESCHMDQMIEKDRTNIRLRFPKSFLSVNNDSSLLTDETYEGNWIFDQWNAGKIKLNNRQLNMLINRIMENERDCEERTVNKIKKWKLDEIINLEDYIRHANIYVLTFEMIKKLKCWVTFFNHPESTKNVYSLFSNKRIYKKIKLSKRQLMAIKKHCIR